MKLKAGLLFAASGSLLVILALFNFISQGKKKDFYRVDLKNFQPDTKNFRVDKRLGKLFFKQGKEETWIKDIPSLHGYYFFINKGKNISLHPDYSGDIGFYTHINFKSDNEFSPIRFTMEIISGGISRQIEKLEYYQYGHPLFKNLSLKRGDTLQLRFTGKGYIYFSKPIFYKKKNPDSRKNIILIGVDTLRGDQIGIKVNGHSLTPHIDQFVKEGIFFTNAYAQSPWTLPSFISLFTGLNEFNHRVNIRNPLEFDKPQLVQNLSKKFVTWGYHGGLVLSRRWGFSRGFDYYREFSQTGPLFARGGQTLFKKALAFLERSQFPDLFLFLHTYQVHSPYTPPREFLFKLFKKPKFFKLDAVSNLDPSAKYLPIKKDGLKRAYKELYQAEIHAFDSYFGDFIRGLKKQGIYENALIVFLSDHGEEFFEHKGWEHAHSLYNEILRVPLIIKFPGQKFHNRKIKEAVGLIDIFPTILKYYDVSCEESRLDGLNLLPVIQGNKREGNLFSSNSAGRYIDAIPPKFAIFFEGKKIIYNFPFTDKDLDFFRKNKLPPECPKIELYELEKDPAEEANRVLEQKNLVRKIMPLIIQMKKTIQKCMSVLPDRHKPLDSEVKKQLKTLGYL